MAEVAFTARRSQWRAVPTQETELTDTDRLSHHPVVMTMNKFALSFVA